MMWYEVPFEAEHVFKMELQEDQKWIKQYTSLPGIKTLENEWSGTLMQDEDPMACAGVIPLWTDRAMVWSFISNKITPSNFPIVHRHGEEFLAGLPFRRLEAAVDINFAAGHRWIKMLGFELEAARMRAFQIDGRDCSLYARVRG